MAEQLLWKYLKGRNQFGIRFRRQYPIHDYIVDFCCYQRKLVIELDGPIHETQQEYDQSKDFVLAQYGFVVLRFKNEDVMNDIQTVLKQVNGSLFSSLGEES